jgi:hypothetical protein
VFNQRGENMFENCEECGRVFDLLDIYQADEYFYGHDCEPEADIVDMNYDGDALASMSFGLDEDYGSYRDDYSY